MRESESDIERERGGSLVGRPRREREREVLCCESCLGFGCFGSEREGEGETAGLGVMIGILCGGFYSSINFEFFD